MERKGQGTGRFEVSNFFGSLQILFVKRIEFPIQAALRWKGGVWILRSNLLDEGIRTMDCFWMFS